MAGEVKLQGQGTGRTAYFRILGSGGSVWSTDSDSYEAYSALNWANYVIALVEQGSTALYIGSVPATVPAGVLDIDARYQAGGSPATTDGNAGGGNVQWNGSAQVPLSDLSTSGQVGQFAPLRIARGVAISNFPFKLVSAVDHVTPLVSGVVSGQVSRDGGAFGALQSGAFTEMGFGFYRVNLTSGDLLANTVALHFTAQGVSGGASDPRDFTLITQKTSGQ